MEKARNIAAKGNIKRAKVSAIAMTEAGHIITFAHNRQVKNNSNRMSQHAEEVLVSKLHKLRAFSRFKDLVILVIRIRSKGDLAMSKPCMCCQKILNKYDLTVYYSNQIGIIEVLN